MFKIIESDNEIGSCEYCGAVGGVFGIFTNVHDVVTETLLIS